MSGAKIEYWGLGMVVGNSNHALLTEIALFWLKDILTWLGVVHSHPPGTWDSTLDLGVNLGMESILIQELPVIMPRLTTLLPK